MTDRQPQEVLATLDLYGHSIIPFDTGRANIARATLIMNTEAQFFEHPDDRMVEDIWALRGPDSEINRCLRERSLATFSPSPNTTRAIAGIWVARV